MSKDVIVNGETFTGVSTVKLNTADGGSATFRDTSEIQQGYTVDDIASNNISGDITLGVSTVEAGTFYNKTNITGVSSDTVTVIKNNAFENCTGLCMVEFPNLTTINNQKPFSGCTSLEVVNFPKLTNTGEGWLVSGCTKLRELRIPKATTSTQYLVQNCTALELLDAGLISSFGYGALMKCSALKTLILRNSSVVTGVDSTCIQNSSLANGGVGCTVYVPEALLESYPENAQWATIVGYGTVTFAAIEGSEYE